ncbi:MAG: metal ABC transporter permease [Oligoflexia bacterium]|nr:metal ABC transporter permease [Oligoflexia bacterium]
MSATTISDPDLLRLLTAALVGGAAGFLGSLLISRKMALVGDALGHVALPGMGLALTLGIDPELGAFLSLSLGIFLVWRLGERTVLSLETLIGILFVSSLALGFLLVPEPELLESLVGDLSRLTPAGAAWAALLALGLSLLVRRIYKGMMLLNISPDLAAVEGVIPGRHNLLYLAAIAILVAIGIRITGSLLVGALVILPPASARLMCCDLHRYARLSAGLGVLGCLIGVGVSESTGFQAGPGIILTNSAIFALVVTFRALRRADQATLG